MWLITFCWIQTIVCDVTVYWLLQPRVIGFSIKYHELWEGRVQSLILVFPITTKHSFMASLDENAKLRLYFVLIRTQQFINSNTQGWLQSNPEAIQNYHLWPAGQIQLYLFLYSRFFKSYFSGDWRDKNIKSLLTSPGSLWVYSWIEGSNKSKYEKCCFWET